VKIYQSISIVGHGMKWNEEYAELRRHEYV
jgi:hypothetical protein